VAKISLFGLTKRHLSSKKGAKNSSNQASALSFACPNPWWAGALLCFEERVPAQSSWRLTPATVGGSKRLAEALSSRRRP
jgi:hypothetical protein